MRTATLAFVAIVLGVVGYALEPQAINRLFTSAFHHGTTEVVQRAEDFSASVGFTTEIIEVGGARRTVFIADNDVERYRGLSGREKLDLDRGMLFVFPTAEHYSFTMRGMRFPLDFIWIRSNRVVEVTRNIAPPAAGAEPQTITPGQLADMVLEVNAGAADAWGVTVGTEVSRPNA